MQSIEPLLQALFVEEVLANRNLLKVHAFLEIVHADDALNCFVLVVKLAESQVFQVRYEN